MRLSLLVIAAHAAFAAPIALHAQADSARVSGAVTVRGGGAAQGATVTIRGTVARTHTDSTGHFALPPVPVGSYVLTVSGATLEPATLPITLLRDTTLAVTVDLAAVHLAGVEVRASSYPGAMSSLPDVSGTYVYSGQKTEVVRLDSVGANRVQNVTREILARVPGANVSETEGAGFPSNGLGFRGLSPVQSVEVNTRQDGVNIVADLYGYPETYYAPPAEALERIDLVRGASSLQFGPQFGGAVNYRLRDGTPNTAPAFTVHQSGGSYGLFDSFLSTSGGTGPWTYFGFVQYRGQEGWRPNSDLSQVSAAARIGYRASDKVRLHFEYSLLRNRIHMPGGLDDQEFQDDPRSSFRSRNWLASPWNILAGTVDADLSAHTHLSSTISVLASQRYLVWRNEDGGPEAPDNIDSTTLSFSPREVEREYFANVTSETRLLTSYQLLGGEHTFTTGLRLFSGSLHRQEDGDGTTGSDFDLTLTQPGYGTDVTFGTRNAAWYAENVFRLTPRLSLSPGVRVEFLRSTADGHTDTTFVPQSRDRTFALAGLGAQYDLGGRSQVYGNITQAYRPIEYSFLTPFASAAKVDPNLRDPKGYDADVGWRGTPVSGLSFDVGAYYIAYNDRIGLVSFDSGSVVTLERTNVANSVHKGFESYVEVLPFTLFNAPEAWGTLRLFDALGYTHARYTSGDFARNTVEYAPATINRAGVSYGAGRFTVSLQWSAVARQFTDANNTVSSPDADVGLIPAYQVLDGTLSVELSARAVLSGGLDNIGGEKYFTLRTPEYPGPGIIPGLGRSGYLGLRLGF